jgi:predicted nucleic acid-binding protein
MIVPFKGASAEQFGQSISALAIVDSIELNCANAIIAPFKGASAEQFDKSVDLRSSHRWLDWIELRECNNRAIQKSKRRSTDLRSRHRCSIELNRAKAIIAPLKASADLMKKSVDLRSSHRLLDWVERTCTPQDHPFLPYE